MTLTRFFALVALSLFSLSSQAHSFDAMRASACAFTSAPIALRAAINALRRSAFTVSVFIVQKNAWVVDLLQERMLF